MTLIFAALLLGVVNAIVPAHRLRAPDSCQSTLLTLGPFLLIINAAMLGLVAAFLPGFCDQRFLGRVLGRDHRQRRELDRRGALQEKD